MGTDISDSVVFTPNHLHSLHPDGEFLSICEFPKGRYRSYSLTLAESARRGAGRDAFDFLTVCAAARKVRVCG
jgi:hypothetical protein